MSGSEEPVETVAISGSHESAPVAAEPRVSRWRAFKKQVRDLLRHSGPGWLMTVSMVDPGNLFADINSGSQFGYTQLWVTWWSHVAMVCVSWIGARLVFGQLPVQDFAKCERSFYRRPKVARYVLWIIAEFIVVITDMPEVIGFAFGISILTGLPVWAGVLLSLIPTIIFLGLEKFGFRALELVVIILLNILLSVVLITLGISGANAREIFRGWWQPRLVGNESAVFAALGTIGSVIMPHNFYLQTAALVAHHAEAFGPGLGDDEDDFEVLGGTTAGLEVQVPDCGDAVEEVDMKSETYRFSKIKAFTLESIAPVLYAFVVNLSMIAITAKHVHPGTSSSSPVSENLGLFNICKVFKFPGSCQFWAVTLLASGQASVITTTITGNFVMKSFVDIKLNRFVRPLATRGIAILPALVVSAVSANESTVNSIIGIVNVTLAFLLPIVLVPMIRINNARQKLHWFPIACLYFFAFALVPFNLYTLTGPDGEMFGKYTGYTGGGNFRWAVQANILQDIAVASYIALLGYLAFL
jgi:NRAMP (natural resistance-associated macrophage protein)-like metal ion transporter